MNISAEDRVALILGRAVMRAEALQARLEQAQLRIAALEALADCDVVAKGENHD